MESIDETKEVVDTIGKRLKIFRNFVGYSQIDFAKKLDTAFSTYKTYELDKTNIPHNFVSKLSDKFPEVSLEWFINGHGLMLSANNILNQYIDFQFKKKIDLLEITKRLFERFWHDYYTVSNASLISFYETNDYTEIVTLNDIQKMADFISLVCGFDYSYNVRENIIPYKDFFSFPVLHNISLEWLFFGEAYEDDQKKHSEIIALLKYASPFFINKLKEKLNDMKNIQSLAF